METAKLNNDVYEKTITRTSINSKLKQIALLYANNETVVKASERRKKPFTVNDYLIYDRYDKKSETKTTTLLMLVVYNNGESELLTTNSNSIITTFLDVVDNLEDEELDLDDIIFSIGAKQSKNGREYNTLEFRVI